jgi:hypothetical protein
MGLFKGNTPTPQKSEPQGDNYHAFSTPFYKVGGGNLSLPYISNYVTTNNVVRFGTDNLYPQLLNQMYFTSPLHGAIVNFKSRAAVGGGYTINTEKLVAKDKVNVYTFEKRNKLARLVDIIAKDIIIHNRVYFLLTFENDGTLKYLSRISPEKVRVNGDKTKYAVCEDWSQNSKIEYYKPYGRLNKAKEQIYCYELFSVGQDIYPLPQYSSALNWVFLDGEMSYLHKSNILNSIFPSFALMFPQIPKSDEERNKLRKQVEDMKGASNAGKVATFFANGKDNMPEISPIPVNQNDQLFLQTDERIDGKICQAHEIDPLIFGIRVSGKLGSGTELDKSYMIFEKNTVMPLRADIEEVVNDLMDISKVKGQFSINEYSIVNEIIVEDKK